MNRNKWRVGSAESGGQRENSAGESEGGDGGGKTKSAKTKRPGSYQGNTLWWLGSAADGHHAQRRYTIHDTLNEPELNQARNSPNPDR